MAVFFHTVAVDLDKRKKYVNFHNIDNIGNFDFQTYSYLTFLKTINDVRL